MKKRKNIIFLLIAVVVAFTSIAYKRVSTLESGEEYGVDAFYHVKMADGGPLICLQKKFPHTTMSIWKEHFYDKELGFHLVLTTIRSWKRLLHFSSEPPFHLSALFFILLNLGVFAFLAYRFDPEFAFLWPIFYLFLAPGFTNRMLMLRPHSLSITLLLLAAYFFPKVLTRKQWLIPLIFPICFVYSYSNPHFILIPAGLWAIFLGADKKFKTAFFVVAVAILSLAMAMLIHPQFPNTFIIWKIQCVDVVTEILFANYDIGIARELVSPTRSWLFYNIAIFILGFLNVIFFILFSYRYSLKKSTVYTRYFICLQTFFVVGLFFSIRSIEYATPFAVLTFALLWYDIRTHANVSNKAYKYQLAIVVVIVLLPVFALPWTSQLKLMSSRQFKEYGQWAKINLPAGTVVTNIGWGDFTRLFYNAPHCRYSVGLDPMFAFAYKPDYTKKMRKFHKGEYIIDPKEMRALTGADFAFIGLSDSSERRRADVMIKKLGYRPVYIGKDGCLFDLRSR